MKNSENWKEDTENKEADPTGKFLGKKVGFDLVLVPSALSSWLAISHFPVGDGRKRSVTVQGVCALNPEPVLASF